MFWFYLIFMWIFWMFHIDEWVILVWYFFIYKPMLWDIVLFWWWNSKECLVRWVVGEVVCWGCLTAGFCRLMVVLLQAVYWHWRWILTVRLGYSVCVSVSTRKLAACCCFSGMCAPWIELVLGCFVLVVCCFGFGCVVAASLQVVSFLLRDFVIFLRVQICYFHASVKILAHYIRTK